MSAYGRIAAARGRVLAFMHISDAMLRDAELPILTHYGSSAFLQPSLTPRSGNVRIVTDAQRQPGVA
jgi:hypothetical protein